MRWVTVDAGDGERTGVMQGDEIYLAPAGTTLLGLLQDPAVSLEEAGHAALQRADSVRLDAVRLSAPVPVPPSVRDFLAFEEHLKNARLSRDGTIQPVWYEQPVFYFSNPAAICGARDDIAIAPGCECFDYELEVAAIIGAAGENLQPQEAECRIAGYAVLCDWSARDLQAREMKIGLGPVKGKDTATSLGPCLVTPDELADRRSGKSFALTMRAEVNGVEYTSGDLSSIAWSFGEMVAYASRGTRLMPGDVIGSGTVGRGCILELSNLFGAEKYPWLQAGDHVTLEVERLGRLDHTVREPRHSGWVPRPLEGHR
jgi:2-keto-4-pentenoate hydratase/2-oxohepta-3-ene-1,7-dioic acid hydratase in catechol pathway